MSNDSEDSTRRLVEHLTDLTDDELTVTRRQVREAVVEAELAREDSDMAVRIIDMIRAKRMRFYDYMGWKR
jgi:hypothetical protein